MERSNSSPVKSRSHSLFFRAISLMVPCYQSADDIPAITLKTVDLPQNWNFGSFNLEPPEAPFSTNFRMRSLSLRMLYAAIVTYRIDLTIQPLECNRFSGLFFVPFWSLNCQRCQPKTDMNWHAGGEFCTAWSGWAGQGYGRRLKEFWCLKK